MYLGYKKRSKNKNVTIEQYGECLDLIFSLQIQRFILYKFYASPLFVLRVMNRTLFKANDSAPLLKAGERQPHRQLFALNLYVAWATVGRMREREATREG